MNKTRTQKGFTLIEMLISISVFAIIMTASASAFLSIVDANRKAQSLKTVVNNLQFALESMTRNIRVGSHYHCGESGVIAEPKDCIGTGDNFFAFEKTDGNTTDSTDQVVYALVEGQIVKSTDSGNTFLPLTDTDVNITTLNFYVSGSSVVDDRQPRVLIVVKGSVALTTKQKTEFVIQTTVSQRLFDGGFSAH